MTVRTASLLRIYLPYTLENLFLLLNSRGPTTQVDCPLLFKGLPMNNATEQYKINLVELGFSWFRCYGLSRYTLYIVPILPSGKPVFPDDYLTL